MGVINGQGDGRITGATTTDSREDLATAMGLSPDPPPAAAAAPAGTDPAAAEPAADPAAEPAAADPAPAPDADAAAASAAGRTLNQRKTAVQKRIDELTREKHTNARERDQARQDLEEARTELEALRAGGAAPRTTDRTDPEPEPVVAAAVADTRAKPKLDDFETTEDYVEAVVEWKQEQKDAKDTAAADARQRDADRRAALEQEDQVLATFEERVASAKTQFADWDATMESVKDIPVTAAIQAHLVNVEDGPLLLYHLAANPGQYDRIAQLPPARQIEALGKMSARLEAGLPPFGRSAAPPADVPNGNGGQPAARVPVSRAPAPMPRVGGGTTAGTKRVEDMTMKEYNAMRDEQERRAGLRR